jgi:hypothetical protein
VTADEAAVAVIDGLEFPRHPPSHSRRRDDPHDTARFDRRERVRVLARDAFMATAEDMIITKLRWASAAVRTKDRDVVRNIIAVRGADLDWDYIERWCTTHGTLPLLVEIRTSLPPG